MKFLLSATVVSIIAVLVTTSLSFARTAVRNGQHPVGVSCSPNPAHVADTVTVTVTMSDVVPDNTTVDVTYGAAATSLSGVQLSNFPSTMTVQAGQSTGTFTCSVSSTSPIGTTNIEASANGGSATATLGVN